MLKLLRKADRSGAGLVAVLAIVVALLTATLGTADAFPAHLRSRHAWLVAHESLEANHYLHRRAAHVAIVGGNQISIEQAPWQVAVFGVYTFIEHGEEFIVLVTCGGSIIDASHVVTAAHCLYNNRTGSPLPAQNVAVVAGVSDLASEHEENEQFREAAGIRIHPYYSYSSEGSPDDVAVVALTGELALNSQAGSAVSAIGLIQAGVTPMEGSQLDLTGFGREAPGVRLSGALNEIGMTLGFSERCGGAADAVWLCASAPSGSGCSGDSGSGLTSSPSSPVLVGVMNNGQVISGEACRANSTNGFVNLAAPEIRDFIEGSPSPPAAPRGGSAIEVRGVPKVGNTLTCSPGGWSGEPAITYLFIDSASGQVLQSGASSTYALTASDVGRTILCEVQATNAGGTGTVRTTSLRAIEAAPVEPHGPASETHSSPTGTTPPAAGGTTSVGSAPAGSGGVEAAKASHEGVALSARNLNVQSSGVALAKLDCKEAEGCGGTLTLTAKETVKSKGHRKTRKVTIGTATFSLEAGETATVKIHLNAAGRALLSAGHGHLAASAAIEETEVHTWTEGVQLVAQPQKAKGSHKRKG